MYTYDPRSGEWKVQRQKGPGAFWPSSVASWWAPGSVRVPISHKVERSRGSLLIDILFLHTNMQTWAHTHTPLYAHSKKQKFFKSFLWIYCVSQQHTKSRHCVLYILTEHCSSHTKPSHFLRLLSWMLCASVKMWLQQFGGADLVSGTARHAQTHTSTLFLVPVLVSEGNQVSECIKSRPRKWFKWCPVRFHPAWYGWACPKLLPILRERKDPKFLSYRRKYRQDHICN